MTMPIREQQLEWASSQIQTNKHSGLSLELLTGKFSFLFQLGCQACSMYITLRLLVTVLPPQVEC